jgi:hypothetical protein
VSTTAVEPIRIQLPPLHPGQALIERSKALYIIVVNGRRFGKTTFGVRKCIKYALKTGYMYWWVGPTYKEANIGWKMLKKLAYQINQISPVEIREADMEVIFANGGSIVIRSADKPDSLRGEKLGGVVLDEFPQIKPETWYEVLQPALSDLEGWALFIGTPKGRNWAYKLFQDAQNDPEWEAFTIPTAITEDGTANTPVVGSNNPYVSIRALQRMQRNMSATQFAQEVLADFGASQYLVYPEVQRTFHEWRGPVPKFVRYYGGMDFGGDTIGAHSSVTGIAGLTEKDELVIIACFKQSGPNIAERQFNWTWEQEKRLAEVHRVLKQPYHGVVYRADKTQSLGIQFMRNSGLHVFPTKGGADSIEEGIELVHRRLKLRSEDGSPEDTGRMRPRLFWLAGVPHIQEAFDTYRYHEPKNDGSVEKKNPIKVNDDVVDTIRYLVEGVDGIVIGDPQKLYLPMVPRVSNG